MEESNKQSQVQRESFTTISAQVEDALLWLESIVPTVRATRFGAYTRSIKTLVARHKNQENDVLASNFDEYANAILEVKELLTIMEYLRKVDLASVRGLLKKIAGGPVIYHDENPSESTNAPRNFATELHLAAKLHGAGLAALLPGAEDVRTRFRGRTIYFECKRPFSLDSVEENLTKAASQLSSRYSKQNSLERGIVLCDLSRSIKLAFGFPVKNDSELLSSMNNEVDKVIAVSGQALRKIVHPKTIGVAFRLACMTEIEDKSLLTYGSFYTFMALRSRSLRDQAVVRHLAEFLMQSGTTNYFLELEQR